MKRKQKLIILSIAITVLLVLLVSLYIYKKSHNGKDEKPVEIVELANIPGYDYVLEDRDTELYTTTFENLKEVLTSSQVDFESYAKFLAELYIIDLYTITNKMNHYDIGSVDFVSEDTKESFELKVRDTLYKYVEDNTYGKRQQELPEVASTGSSDPEEITVKLGDKTYDGYTVNVTWNYTKDLGYDTQAKITMAKIEDKLYVTNQSASQ